MRCIEAAQEKLGDGFAPSVILIDKADEKIFAIKELGLRARLFCFTRYIL